MVFKIQTFHSLYSCENPNQEQRFSTINSIRTKLGNDFGVNQELQLNNNGDDNNHSWGIQSLASNQSKPEER